jgi:hypothetical protein
MDAKTWKKVDVITSEETVHLCRFIAMEFFLKSLEEFNSINEFPSQVEFLRQNAMDFSFDYLDDVLDKVTDEKNERSVYAICYSKFINSVKEINQKETR